MKTILIFYSYSGSTKKFAYKIAGEEDADIFEVRDRKKPAKLIAYIGGGFGAIRMKKSRIEPITADLTAYDKIIIMAPIWAGHPAPAILNVFDMLPGGKQVQVLLVSMSGDSSCEDKIKVLVENRGCKLTEFRNIKNK